MREPSQKIAILGFGTEGHSAYKYFSRQQLGAGSAEITICDQNPQIELPAGVRGKLGLTYLEELDQFDLIVRSPGIALDQIKTSKPVTSGTKEFFAKSPAKVIGVTGTKGKGTTATLIHRFLVANGQRAYLGGNIGVPALDFLEGLKPTDWVVLELSSYQLDDLKVSPHISVGLMISNDHLSFHGSREAYVEAKANIFRYQNRADIAVYHKLNPDSARIATLSLGQKRPFFDRDWAHISEKTIWVGESQICRVSEVGLLGAHNLENIAAALNAVSGQIDDASILSRVIKDFKGLEHRLEPLATIDGRQFINDSFSATPEATIAAIQSFSQPKVLIMGGFDKGLDYQFLTNEVSQSKVKTVILIGQTSNKIAKLLNKQGYTNIVLGLNSMPAIVKEAYNKAVAGDVILLSPGTSSFDMFRDFRDRGEQFKAAVNNLQKADRV